MTAHPDRTFWIIAADAVLFVIALSSLGLLAAMTYGMILDDVAVMIIFPIMLSPLSLGVIAFAGVELITGDSLTIAHRLWKRIRSITHREEQS